MSCENKINEYLKKLENDKLMMETQFAQVEELIKDDTDYDKDYMYQIISMFNLTRIHYDRICEDLISFVKIFDLEDKKEIRLYKMELIDELIQKEIEKLSD